MGYIQINEESIRFIQSLGYTERKNDSESRYFTNDKGFQVRLDKEYDEIAILDPHGNPVVKEIGKLNTAFLSVGY